jgi:phosphoenolpyruvate carboxykinase (ATP)
MTGGRRMPIRVTRRLLTAALDGSLTKADYRRDPYFGFAVRPRCRASSRTSCIR